MYPSSFLRLVAAGPLYSAERWSLSMSLVPDDGAQFGTVPDEVPAGVRTALEQMFQGANVSGVAAFDQVKLNLIGTNGKYVDATNTVEYLYEPISAGGRNANYIAPQVALAVTLTTEAARGLAHAGRFYLPVPSWNCDNTGRITAADAITTANAVAAAVNAINTAVPGWRVGVASDVREGAFRPVTGVRVGRVLDTIRSRRTSLPEDHREATTLVTA